MTDTVRKINVEQKRTVRARSATVRAAKRKRGRYHWRCWWTPPFGHAWYKHSAHNGPVGSVRRCAGCGWQQSWLSNPRGGAWS